MNNLARSRWLRVNWSERRHIQVLAACAAMGLVHVAVASVPGLPVLSLSASDGRLAQLSGAISQLWGIEATILGAVLVAMFFAFGAVREADPPSATLDGLLADIGFGWTLGVFTSALVGSGLTTLLLQNPAWQWAVAAPGLGFLPLMDFAFFPAVVFALVFIVSKAVKYLYPSAIRNLTLRQASKLAATVSAFERRQRKEPSEFVQNGNFVSIKWRELTPPPEDGLLRLLFAELKERGSRAIAADDPAGLGEVFQVLRVALRSHHHSGGMAEEAKGFHASTLDDQPILSDLSSPATPTNVESITIELLNEFNPTPISRCTPSVVWFPFSIWNDGVENDSHRSARLGLELAARSYWAAASKASAEMKGEWARMWRDYPYGPEWYLTHTSRSSVLKEGAKEWLILHHLLSVHEVVQCSMTAMCLALIKADRGTFGAIICSRLTTWNSLWPVRDHHYDFPDTAKTLLADMRRTELQGLLVLAGVAAVMCHRGEDMKVEIGLIMRLINEAYSSVRDEELGVVFGPTLKSTEDWYLLAMLIADGLTYHDNSHDEVYVDDVGVWGFLIYVTTRYSPLDKKDKKVLSGLVKGDMRVRSACETMSASESTRKLLSADLWTVIDQALATEPSAGKDRRPGSRRPRQTR